MRNGQTWSGRTRLQQIRMLWVIYITCRAAAQDANGIEAYEGTTVRRAAPSAESRGGQGDWETRGDGEPEQRGNGGKGDLGQVVPSAEKRDEVRERGEGREETEQ